MRAEADYRVLPPELVDGQSLRILQLLDLLYLLIVPLCLFVDQHLHTPKAETTPGLNGGSFKKPTMKWTRVRGAKTDRESFLRYAYT